MIRMHPADTTTTMKKVRNVTAESTDITMNTVTTATASTK